MAKVTGLLQFYGTLHGINLYAMEGKVVARAAKTISKKKYKTAPNYAPFRDAGKEMGRASITSKDFRFPLFLQTRGIAENRMYSRMNALMRHLINLDGTSLRGERKVANGIATAEGKALMKGFEFNCHASLGSVLQAPYVLDVAANSFFIKDLKTNVDLKAPEAATHVNMTLLRYDFDFVTNVYQLTMSDAAVLPLDSSLQNLELVASPVGVTTGTTLYLLRILFYQDVNGALYALKGMDCGAVSILEVVTDI